MSDDAGLAILIDKPDDIIRFITHWIRENEPELEKLAAETGKYQKRTIAIANDAEQTRLLEIHITCEPRQFAKHSVEGEWAKMIEPK